VPFVGTSHLAHHCDCERRQRQYEDWNEVGAPSPPQADTECEPREQRQTHEHQVILGPVPYRGGYVRIPRHRIGRPARRSRARQRQFSDQEIVGFRSLDIEHELEKAAAFEQLGDDGVGAIAGGFRHHLLLVDGHGHMGIGDW
jgi:hypothetical protein